MLLMPAEAVFWQTVFYLIFSILLFVLAWWMMSRGKTVRLFARVLMLIVMLLFVPVSYPTLDLFHVPSTLQLFGNSDTLVHLTSALYWVPLIWLILCLVGLTASMPGQRQVSWIMGLCVVGLLVVYLVDLRVNHTRSLDDPASMALLDVFKRVESGESVEFVLPRAAPENKRWSVNEMLDERKAACGVPATTKPLELQRIGYGPRRLLVGAAIKGRITADGDEQVWTYTLVGFPGCWFVIQSEFGRKSSGEVVLRRVRLGEGFKVRENALRDGSDAYRRTSKMFEYENTLMQGFD